MGTISVVSAGTGALVGEPIQPSAARLLSGVGADVEAFEARELTAELVESADLVLGLTRRHRSAVAQLSPKSMPRLFTLREFARLARSAAEQGWHGPEEPAPRVASLADAARAQRGVLPATEADDNVPDPYGGPDEAYEHAFRVIEPAVRDLARLLAPDDRD